MNDNKFAGGWKGRRANRVRREGLMRRQKEGADREPANSSSRDVEGEIRILRDGPILPLFEQKRAELAEDLQRKGGK